MTKRQTRSTAYPQVVRHATRFALESNCRVVKQVVPDMVAVQYSEKYASNGEQRDMERGLKRAKAFTMLLLALPGSTYIYQ